MHTRGKSRFLYGFIEVSKYYDFENTVYGQLKNIGHFDVLYCQEKFYGEFYKCYSIQGVISPGNHLNMQGELDPCRPGCQPAIRSYIQENGELQNIMLLQRVILFRGRTTVVPNLRVLLNRQ